MPCMRKTLPKQTAATDQQHYLHHLFNACCPYHSLRPLLRSAMADEEPLDQKRYLEDSCKPKCVKPLLEYQACIKRIHGDESGHKHCTGQYFDYWSCVDKCVAPKLFSQLK